MPVQPIDLTGHQYGHVSVISFLRRENAKVFLWKCRCSCGAEFVARGNNLRSGNTKTCGCFHGLKIEKPLTHNCIKKLIVYDPDTGFITRRVSGLGYKQGDVMGFFDSSVGYYKLTLEGVKFYVHQMAWWYMTGKFPECQIDHADRVRTNNKWKNLRTANQTQQNANRTNEITSERKLSRFRGVSRSKNKWIAQIGFNNKNISLGIFKTEQQAAKAYDLKAIVLFGEFANLNFERQNYV